MIYISLKMKQNMYVLFAVFEIQEENEHLIRYQSIFGLHLNQSSFKLEVIKTKSLEYGDPQTSSGYLKDILSAFLVLH